MNFFYLSLLLNVNTIIFGKLQIEIGIKNGVLLVKKFIKKINKKNLKKKKWKNNKTIRENK